MHGFSSPGLHRRSFSAVRISIDRMLDEDDLAAAATTLSTPLLSSPVLSKEKEAAIARTTVRHGTPTPPRWRSRRTVGRSGSARLVVVLLVAATAAAGLIVHLFASRVHSPLPRVAAHVHAWRSRLASTPADLRTDHTYAYATPMPSGTSAYEEHPVHGLIRDAKRRWQTKVAQQSKSYGAAVREYKRRNSRDPPPGFRAWHQWAKDHQVQLLDEYDAISKQTEPFYAIRPSILRERLAEQEDLSGRGYNYGIIRVQDGKLEISGSKWRPAVTGGFVELMEPLAHLLPDNLTIPLFLHDGPSTAHTATAMQEYRRAAREGRFVDETSMNVFGDMTRTRQAWQCAPDSPFRLKEVGIDAPGQPGPAFIHDHERGMSYCSNPHNFAVHGATANGPALDVLRPSFGLSRQEWNGDIVWPSTIQYDLNPKNESAFRDKAHTLLWRGSPDGVEVQPNDKWRRSHRFRLINLMNSNSSQLRSVRETRLDRFGYEYQVDVEHSFAELNERYSNVRPTGVAVQCVRELCDEIEATMPWAPKASLEEMADNRYVMDVDGNAYSARFRAHLASNQIPFKSTVFPEWYAGRIEPWVHYVPVRVDYSDLYNLLAFFDGGLDEARTGNHDELGEEISLAGSDWAARFWRIEDMQAYVFRLLLEWARIMDLEREKDVL